MLQEETSTTLSIVDSSGRQVSILNSTPSRPLVSQPEPQPLNQHHYHQQDVALMEVSTAPIKRKYVCNESGCFKSFTTSGHLSRHSRIHSGEKNFPCLFPGCQSRFSRQDNMMQHYRTHMSPKSKRPKRQLDDKLQPRLHAHNRIISDITAPLTIDQHLHNYHQSRTDYRHHSQQQLQKRLPSHRATVGNNAKSSFATDRQETHSFNTNFSPMASALSSSSSSSPATLLTTNNQPIQRRVIVDSTFSSSEDMFYQHRPLIYTECQDTNPTTLLNPTPVDKNHHHHRPQSSALASPSSPPLPSKIENDTGSNGLVQLANIVSSFG
ncbi:unnamed protein product [Absidia cylindrospora]